MRAEWQLQTAKNRLSRVVEEAQHQGPQVITLRGKPRVVVISIEDYTRLSASGGRLSAFFARSPLRGQPVDLRRSPDAARDVAL